MKNLTLCLLTIVVFSFNNVFSQNGFKPNKFISGADTIDYYRPTEDYIEELQKVSAGAWYKLQFYINYLDKMQNAISENKSLKSIPGPTPGKSIGESVANIQSESKKNKKAHKLIAIVDPQWFEDAYNFYVLAEKSKNDRSLKPTSFIARNDSVEFKSLCDSLVHISNTELNYETCYYDNSNNVFVWNYKGNSSSMAVGFYKDYKGDSYRLKMIDGSFEELYTIWTKYFGGQKSMAEFSKMKLSMSIPYEDIKISIKGKGTMIGTLFKVGKSWRIRL